MRLVRFGEPGQERPGVWLDGDASSSTGPKIVDIRACAFDIHDYDRTFFERRGLERVAQLLREPQAARLDARNVRLGPPVGRPGKIICLGKNYAEHAREFDSQIPDTPILFSKAVSALNGPYDPIHLAPDAGRTDWEVELAVIIGHRARQVPESQAMDYVAGYTILNDVTDRDAQKQGQQWFRGKSADTFCPLGPFFVTADEIPDPHRLRLTSRCNGRLFQNGNTADLIFKIPFLIAFISRTITLEPGDIVATGTPAGIGTAQKPPVVLSAGDVVEVEVELLGAQRSPVVRDTR